MGFRGDPDLGESSHGEAGGQGGQQRGRPQRRAAPGEAVHRPGVVEEREADPLIGEPHRAGDRVRIARGSVHAEAAAKAAKGAAQAKVNVKATLAATRSKSQVGRLQPCGFRYISSGMTNFSKKGQMVSSMPGTTTGPG